MKKIRLKYFCYNSGACQVYYKSGRALYCFQDRGDDGVVFLRCSHDGEPNYELDIEQIETIDQMPPQKFVKELKKSDVKLLKSLTSTSKTSDKKIINRLILSIVATINKHYIISERNGKIRLIRKFSANEIHQSTII